MPDPSLKPGELKLGSGMVERGIEAWRNHQRATEPPWRVEHEAMTAILTAALRLDDPETVERVAKAVYDNHALNAGDNAWEKQDDDLREWWRGDARAALTALLGDGGAE